MPGWQLLLDRIEAETDPVLHRNLAIVACHVAEEVAGNLPALMATLVAEPEYTVWGASSSGGPRGHDEVLAWYEALVASGRNRLDYAIERVVVDRTCVVTEGEFRYAFSGRDLPSATACESGTAVKPNQWYLVTHRALIVWPISVNGLIEGEHIYAGERHRVRRPLAAGELPRLGPLNRSTPGRVAPA